MYEIGNLSFKSLDGLKSEVVKSFDISVIITDHSNIDYNLIRLNSSSIIDTRNVYQNVKMESLKRLGEG